MVEKENSDNLSKTDEAHADVLLRAALESKYALENGGYDLTHMTRQERRTALFGSQPDAKNSICHELLAGDVIKSCGSQQTDREDG